MHRPRLEEIELAMEPLGLKLQYLNVGGPKQIEPAFQQARKERADAAIWLVPDATYNSNRAQVVQLAVKNRLPVIYFRRINVEACGLMFYGVDFTDLDRRAARYGDKIL